MLLLTLLCLNSLLSVKPVSTFSLCQYRELCLPTGPLYIIYKYDRDLRPVAPVEGYHLTYGSTPTPSLYHTLNGAGH